MSVLAIEPQDAQAYLDPGTGSYLLQALVAALMGSLYMLKIYWAKVKGLFSSESGDSKEDRDDE